MEKILEEQLKGKFFKKGTRVRGKKEQLCVLVQAVYLLDWKSDMEQYSKITTKNCAEMAERIEASYGNEKRMRLMSIMDFLEDASFCSHPFLTAENVPFVIVCAKWAMEHNYSAESFRKLVDEWEKKKRVCGSYKNPKDKLQYFEASTSAYYR